MIGTGTAVLVLLLAIVFFPIGLALGRLKWTSVAVVIAITITGAIVIPLTVFSQALATSHMNMGGDQGWGYVIGMYAALFIGGFMFAGIAVMRFGTSAGKASPYVTQGRSPWPQNKDTK